MPRRRAPGSVPFWGREGASASTRTARRTEKTGNQQPGFHLSPPTWGESSAIRTGNVVRGVLVLSLPLPLKGLVDKQIYTDRNTAQTRRPQLSRACLMGTASGHDGVSGRPGGDPFSCRFITLTAATPEQYLIVSPPCNSGVF